MVHQSMSLDTKINDGFFFLLIYESYFSTFVSV